jgi:hypothetical protein
LTFARAVLEFPKEEPQMLLSDAIMLGSTQTRLDSSIWYSKENQCGCLIGMGLFGSGATKYVDDMEMDTELVIRTFPWLGENRFEMPEQVRTFKVKHGFTIPCVGFGSGFQEGSAIEIISGMARMIKCGLWTLEQAVDWIRQNEPAETPEEKREVVNMFCDNLVNQQ